MTESDLDAFLTRSLEDQVAALGGLKAIRSRSQSVSRYSFGDLGESGLRFLERIGRDKPSPVALRLLSVVYRESGEPKAKNRLARTLVLLDLRMLESEFTVPEIAKMAVAAWAYDSSFSPSIGQTDRHYNPNTLEFEELPTKVRNGWEEVAAEIHADLAEPALKNMFHWTSSSLENLLLGMGSGCIPLLLERIDSRPTGELAPHEAANHWCTAVKVLGKIGTREHLANIERLDAAAGSAVPEVHWACHWAVAAIDERSNSAHTEAADKARTLRDLENCIDGLRNNDAQIRVGAADTFGQIRNPRAVQPLTISLADPDPRVRRVAAWALGKIGDASALAALEQLLTDPDENVLKEVKAAVEVVKRQQVPSRRE